MPYDFVLRTTTYLDPRERPDECTDAALQGRPVSFKGSDPLNRFTP